MEDKKILKAEELSEDELDQAAGGFVTGTVDGANKTAVKQMKKTAVKALVDNKSAVKTAVKTAVKSVKDPD